MIQNENSLVEQFIFLKMVSIVVKSNFLIMKNKFLTNFRKKASKIWDSQIFQMSINSKHFIIIIQNYEISVT